MSWGLEERPGVWAAVISAVIYALLGFLLLAPSGAPPKPELRLPLSAATAAANACSIGLLVGGWISVRGGQRERHKLLMTLALLSISSFLVLYVSRQYIVGTLQFEGPEALYRAVYLPLLIPHLALSAAAVPPVIYNFIVGLTRRMGDVGATLHPQVGRIAVPIWLLSSTLGLLVFGLLQYYRLG